MQQFQPLFNREPDGRRSVAKAAPFASEPSCRWWLRLHGAKAVAAGAIIKHCGEWLFDPLALNRVAQDIGRSTAEESVRAKDRLSADLDGIAA